MISFDPGLIIWTTIIFTLLLILLKKFAWKPILTSVEARNKSIEEALKSAEKAKEEMKTLLVAITTPFLLGNSAPVGALIPLLIGGVIGLGVIIAIVWGLIKWLT